MAVGCTGARPTASSTSTARPHASADLVLRGGQVLTGDRARPRASALAIAGDRIALVGTDAEATALSDSHTRILELGGRTVMPGFIDSHIHFQKGALTRLGIELDDASSVVEIQNRVRAYARAHPAEPGAAGWILGRGWSYNLFAPALPTHQVLDEAERARPVALTSYDGHTLWLNSVALERVGIRAETPDPPGGRIVREPGSRRPAGCLLEKAMALATAKVPPESHAVRLGALRSAFKLTASSGITAFEDFIFDASDAALYQELERTGELTARVVVGPPLGGDLAAYAQLRRQLSGTRLRMGSLKGFVDGVVESSTAAMLEPYSGQTPPVRGELLLSPETLTARVVAADKEGFSVALHAIGDRAVRISLDAFAEATRINGPRERHHRIEHVEVVDRADIPRFGVLGVIASMQPYHASPPETAEDGIWEQKVGRRRLAHAFAWRGLHAAGARLAFGSDWPVVTLDPLIGLYTALTRSSPHGRPDGFGAQQTLPLADALRAYGEDAAYAVGLPETGVLRPGLWADVAVLGRGVSPNAPRTLVGAHVDLTIVAGQVVYEREE